jgi:hypothetical protein
VCQRIPERPENEKALLFLKKRSKKLLVLIRAGFSANDPV